MIARENPFRSERVLAVRYRLPEAGRAALLDRFEAEAAAALPNEHAAWAVWNEQDKRLVYTPVITLEASAGRIQSARPRLAAHEHLAIDMHSHGAGTACFSATDDEDDAGEVKLAIVVGQLDVVRRNYAIRLCAMGLFKEMK